MLEFEKETSALKDKLPQSGLVGAVQLVAFQLVRGWGKTGEETITPS